MERIKIQGMSCQHCVQAVTKALSILEGIEEVSVDLEKGEATFVNKGSVDFAKIRAAVEDAGYQVGS